MGGSRFIGADRPGAGARLADRLAEDFGVDSSARIGIVVASLVLAGSTQHSPEPRRGALERIAVERATLRGVPSAEPSPELAELLRGTAVRTGERRDGFVRVTVEGWVEESALAPLDGEAARAAAPVEESPKPEPPPEPVHELGLAHHVGVAAEAVDRDGGRALSVTVELRTSRERPVLVDGTEHPGRVRFFEQRRIAGGRARGALLLTRDVKFVAGRASLVVPLADLGATTPAMVLVSASAELSPKWTIHGAATDVPLAAR
jgi:hypothetical protein